MNTYFLMITFRVWLVDVGVSAINYFLLINRIYRPRLGELRAHQIGMTTRIVYILVLAYFLVKFAHIHRTVEYLLAGAFWMLLWLAFEWVGSFIIRRPVQEILEGWHIERGYMWPYVLLTYLLSPLVVGLLLNPGQQ